MVGAGLIEDATKLWWDIRPSARFPTLEMRIADIPSRVDDSICIAALYQCMLRRLYRLRRDNQRWRRYSNLLISENRWRAQRYGYEGGLVDFGRGEIVPYAELLEELIELTAEDADALGCTEQVQHARTILDRGTSAHRQLERFHHLVENGLDKAEALRSVVDLLIEETVADL